MNPNNRLTTNQGAPVGDNQNSRTAGRRGPVLLEDYHLVEKLAHFDRERIPERVVHARGAGAHGVFVTKNSMKQYTKAAFYKMKELKRLYLFVFQRLFMVKVLLKQHVTHVGLLLNFIQKKETTIS